MRRLHVAPGRLLVLGLACTLLVTVVAVYATALHRAETELTVPTAYQLPPAAPTK